MYNITNFRVFLISSLGTRQEYICDFFIESGKLYFTRIDLLKSRLILDEEWSYHQLSSDYLPYMSFRKKYFIDYLSSSDRIEITNYDFHLSFDIKDFEKSFTGVLKNQINKELEEYKTNNNIK